MPFTEGWPVRVSPQPDELLSSWFVRTAWANGEKLEPFTSRHYGSHSAIWNRDVDRFAAAHILVPLAIKSGLGRKKIFAMTMFSFEGVLYLAVPRTSVLSWVLPLRKVRRDNLGHSLVYCPICLGEDESPYFRRFWRLAFAVACPRHGIRLLDACQACGAPVCFHVVDRNYTESVGAFSLATCHRCRRDLRRSAGRPLSVDPDIMELVQCLHAIAIDGAPVLDPRDGRSSMQPIAYFLGLRWLARWLATCSKVANLRAAVSDLSGIPTNSRSGTDCRNLFEQRQVGERYLLLRMIAWLLEDWPARFLSAGAKAGLRPSYLARYSDDIEVPYWIDSVVSIHFAAHRYSATDIERNSIVRLLRKHGLEPSAYRINRWLGKIASYQHLRARQQFRLLFDVEHEWQKVREAGSQNKKI
jgi:hypothetical protein